MINRIGIILFLVNIGWSALVEDLFCLDICILYLPRATLKKTFKTC